MKKVLSLLLVFCFMFVLCSCKNTNTKAENPASDFEYKTGDGQATIEKYIGTRKDVIIPEKIDDCTVVSINICAFDETDIESVVIPDTVTTIWNHAFYNCKKLHTVDMGNGVETLIQKTFYGCEKLENLKLSPNLKQSDDAAFSGCSSLKELHIPKTFTAWDMEMFYGNSLTKLTFEDGLESVGAYACFWNDGTLKEVTFPASVKKLGEWTFNTGVENAYFEGDAPAEIGNKPFGDSKVTIHYRKGTNGWEDTKLREWYTLVEE